MLCKETVKTNGTAHPCGQCLFCRINQRREWVARLLLEAACHQSNQFVTLTYEESQLPTQVIPGRPGFKAIARHPAVASQPGTLSKTDLQRFFKRLRKIGNFRYYAVGEYGERMGRPHYHALLFGSDFTTEELEGAWKHGHVHQGDVTAASITYCVEYLIKYRTKKDELLDLRREPEFGVMSRNPGIGTFSIGEIRKSILSSPPLLNGTLLIPDTFRLGGKEHPMPRYIRRQLEDEGFVSSRKALLEACHDPEELQALFARSKVAADVYAEAMALFAPSEEKEEQRLKRAQRILNVEGREALYGKRHDQL